MMDKRSRPPETEPVKILPRVALVLASAEDSKTSFEFRVPPPPTLPSPRK